MTDPAPHTLDPAPGGDDARWQAVLERDPRADGSFVYAVRSTGIYCRPTCPSKRPKRENAAFYPGPAEAEAAGYRACRRCRPDAVDPRRQWIARVQELLETLEPTPTLAELADAVGVSPYHLQRVFKRTTGLSPRQYARALKAARLERGLKAGASVTTALYDAGYGSSRAVYDPADPPLGMTPGRFRDGGENATIRYGRFDSPLGRMLVAATDRGVCALRFGDDDDDELLGELTREFPNATLREDDAATAPYADAVVAWLETYGRNLSLPLDVEATEFQRTVWRALRRIPPGETRSYREVAEMIGRPDAVRAVARACASNPVALVVPCHRVVRTGGALGGYRWGVERKRALLDREAGA